MSQQYISSLNNVSAVMRSNDKPVNILNLQSNTITMLFNLFYVGFLNISTKYKTCNVQTEMLFLIGLIRVLYTTKMMMLHSHNCKSIVSVGQWHA